MADAKRDSVKRIHAALEDKGYRCVKTGMVNFAQSPIQDAGGKRTPTGEDFSLWSGRYGQFVLIADEEKQTFSLYQKVNTIGVDESEVL
jgi:hypothetical protein